VSTARRLLFLACAVLLLEAFYSAVLTPLVPGYRRDLGLTEDATGLLVAAYSIGALLLAIPAGWFSSRFNPRTAVIAGLAGVAGASILFGFAEQIMWLDASRFLLGAFGALMWAGGMSWVVSATPIALRGQIMGTLIAANVIGELLGSPLGALADDFGTEFMFSAIAVLALLMIALARTVPPVAESAGQGFKSAWQSMRGAGLALWVVSFLAISGPAIAIGFVMVVVPLRFEVLGISAWWLAGAFVVMSLIEAIGGPLIGRFSDRVGRKTPYLVGMSLVVVGLASLGVIDQLWQIVAAMVLMAIGCAAAFTTSFTLITDAATMCGLNQGYSSGLSNVAWSGSIIIGAAGGGALIASVSYLGAALLFTAVCLAIAGLCWKMKFPPVGAEVAE
jgi:DHA1 family solute carrier family 18 vesicular amine transporter 1/2